jgi:hypothetical protein
MPNLTFLPFFFSVSTISAMGYCAFATHRPYPSNTEAFELAAGNNRSTAGIDNRLVQKLGWLSQYSV